MFGNEAPKVKVCCKCGKDVTGRKRLRDSLGYWCYECHKADQDAKRPEGVKCPECGRRVASSALMDYDGVFICSRCYKDHMEFSKQKEKFRPGVPSDTYHQHDRKRLFILVAIFLLLLLIIILSKLHVLRPL
jgi:DNA-directed RNA polymerase subunit RPC12/RpoP